MDGPGETLPWGESSRSHLSPARLELLEWVLKNEFARRNDLQRLRIAAELACRRSGTAEKGAATALPGNRLPVERAAPMIGEMIDVGTAREFRNNDRDTSRGQSATSIRYQIAQTRDEREQAFRLIYNSYVRAGLAAPNRYGVRVTPYNLLPTTEMFLAVRGEQVIATLSLVRDGELGLPLGSVYENLVEVRRNQGLSLGEVSCLADCGLEFREFFDIFCELNRLLVQYARFHGVHQLLVAVHPRHSRFYSRYFCFEVIGGLTPYPSVCNHPAVALCMDFERIDRKGVEHPARWRRFFGERLPDSAFTPRPMSELDHEYFARFIPSEYRSTADMLGNLAFASQALSFATA